MKATCRRAQHRDPPEVIHLITQQIHPPTLLTHLGGFEGVICGEMDGEEEDAALVGTVGLQQDTEGLMRTTDAAAGGGANERHADPLRSAMFELQFPD